MYACLSACVCVYCCNNFDFCIGAQSAVLSADLDLSSTVLLCPSDTLELTCAAQNLPTFRWFIGDTEKGSYVYIDTIHTSFPITVLSEPGLEIVILSSALNPLNTDQFSATATLTISGMNIGDWNQPDIVCGSYVIRSVPLHLTPVNLLMSMSDYAWL